MIRVSTTVEVARPAAQVFGVVADAAQNPRWQRGMRSCVWLSPGPIGPGSQYDQVAVMLGREIRSRFEVIAFEADRSLTIATIDSTFPIRVTRMVAVLGPQRCRASAVVEGDAAGVFKVAEPVLKRMVASSLRRDWLRLKAMLEAEDAA